jgi:hypothetical protein
LAALLNQLWHRAGRQPGWYEPDRRNTRTWRELVLAVLVRRATRPVALGQAVLEGGQRAASSAKAAALGLAYFLTTAKFPAETLAPQVLEAAARALDPAQVARYRGRAIVALDPTEYPKRSRGRGKRGRHMQHVGRVRTPATGGPRRKGGQRPRRPRRATGARAATRAEDVATTTGYVDVWAGLVLAGKQFLPLARQLFSSRHPELLSQNTVEQAVLAAALAVLDRLGWAAVVVADRGLGRKELLVGLVAAGRDQVIRIDPDSTAFTPDAPDGALLATLLARQPELGELIWDRGQEGELPCRARTLRAATRFSRTGRQADVTEAALQFVELVPLEGTTDPLVLATTLPLETLADARGVARVYSWRWAIETAFETLKAWGLGRFMVRAWQAIDRLLWVVAVAYALLVVALRAPPLAILHDQAATLLKRLAVLGRRLTVGKLAEAIGLDFARHRRAWTTAWLT